MTALQKGGNVPLPTSTVTLAVAMAASRPSPDVSAYLLRADGRVGGDGDMVFHGQRRSGDGSVSMDDRGLVVAVDLATVPASVARIALAVAFGPEAPPTANFGDVGRLGLSATAGGAQPATFDVDTSGMAERALVLAELYRRDGGWKLRAVAQGFVHGLGPLARHFGVDVADDAPPVPAPTAVPASHKPAVSLSKVSLDKSRPTVDLAKGAGFGKLRVNLDWNRSRSRMAEPVDLDLGCLYELADGRKGCIQALGGDLGSYEHGPYVELAGDDRTGASPDGEWMSLNGAKWPAVRRMLFFAFIYDGAPDWAATDGVVTVHVPGRVPVEVAMEASGGRQSMCAVALLENVYGDIRVTRQVRYFEGHRAMDKAFGWGLRWQKGSKD